MIFENDVIFSPINVGLSIAGTTKKMGVVFSGCLIFLITKKSMNIYAIAISDIDGKFRFKNLQLAEYELFANDQNKQFNAVIQDGVVPK